MKHNIIIYIVSFAAAILAAAGTGGMRTETARAFSEDAIYLRVITEDTPFYADKTATAPLFFLPYTYYVRIIERGELFTHVEYGEGGGALDGYVPTGKLYYDGLSVSRPFPEISVMTAVNAVLYKDSTCTNALQHVFEGRKLYYYGNFVSAQGETVYYVGYNNRLGYVKEADLVPFAIENHPNELTFIENDSEPEQYAQEKEENAERSAFDLRFAVITLLALAGVIALIFAFSKRSKAAPAASYYDENDYE